MRTKVLTARRTLMAIVAVGTVLLVCAPVRTQTGASQAAPTFTLALAGDSIITRRLSVYREPAFLKMIELIRDADAAFTNLEMLFHDYESYPMNESGGTYMRGDPALAKELAWAGFDLVSRANNHTGDYGATGMRLTTKYVTEAGLVQAGVGESLTEAREAKFLETAHGRVALISVASTFPDHSRASTTRGDIPARPGLNPLRFSTTYVVSPQRLEELRATARELGWSSGDEEPAASGGLTLFGCRFIAGSRPEVRTEPDGRDLREIASVVSSARRLADYVIVTIHAHEGGRDRTVPAQFLVTFAHDMIDAGADVFAGHGPHVLRGVELYKGKPVLYSLGDFIFQNDTLLRLPPDNYEPLGLDAAMQVADFDDKRSDFDRRGFPADREIWESVIAIAKWTDKRFAELRLYPISLGFGQPRWERGRPMLASAELAKKIAADLVDRSRPFGTTMGVEDGVVIVRAGTSSQ